MTLRPAVVALPRPRSCSLARCVGATSAAAPKHVILVMMENHGTDTLFGNKEDAPFLNELIAEPGVRYANPILRRHPSEPSQLSGVGRRRRHGNR